MRRVNIDTQLLRSLVAIADSGTFGKAADSLAMTQPAMSQQMRRLEDLVGRPLFQRDGRKLLFTAHGDMLLGYARRILELNDDVHRRLAGDDDREVVHLGMPEHFSESLLPLVIAAVHERFPAIQLVVKVGRSRTLSEMIADGRLDLAVTIAPHEPGSGPPPLYVAPLAWFGAEAAVAGRAASEIPLVLFRPPCGMRSLAIAALERAERPWRCVHESEELAALRAAVQAGLGVTALPMLQSYGGIRPVASDIVLPALPEVAVAVERRPGWAPRTAPGLEDLVVDLWNAFRSGTVDAEAPSAPPPPSLAQSAALSAPA